MLLLILLTGKYYSMRLPERTIITMAASTGNYRLLVDDLYTAVPGIIPVSHSSLYQEYEYLDAKSCDTRSL